MQTARAALGVALRVCPRTLEPQDQPQPSGSQQNCLRPDMPYKTGHADWSGLDLGLFIGAGVLVTAGLYETSQYTGLNLVPLAPHTLAGVLCRSAAFPLGKNGSDACRGDKKDQHVFAQFGTAQCPPNTTKRTDHNNAAVSSENDVTECDDDQDLVKELITPNSDISDQKSPSSCPLGGGQVSEGNAGKHHGFCGDDVTSNVTTDIMHTCGLPDHTEGENAGNDVISRWRETSSRRADFTEAEVITVTACSVRHELSAATRAVIGSTPHATDKTDSEINSEQFLSKFLDYESGHLSKHVPVSPRLQRKLRCAVLYADWREDSQFCHRDDVTTKQKVRFSPFGQQNTDYLDDVTEVRVYCAVLEGA
uniref:Uncharacterized protein n=1 Tax=Branchiostoma floridae TaxID=7739 RepID=C3YJQ8_BRAFL|eukprot:XP_002603354.1 hypothetical protein BRAFLDRAFT_80347 [Branchiostoma floridae]